MHANAGSRRISHARAPAPAPAPPVEVRTYYEPPAQPRSPLFGRTSEPKEEQPAPVEEEEAPARPETSYAFTDARPQSAPADGRKAEVLAFGDDGAVSAPLAADDDELDDLMRELEAEAMELP